MPKKPKEVKEEEDAPPPPVLDALPWIYVSNDKLSAWMLVFPPVGEGRELDQEETGKRREADQAEQRMHLVDTELDSLKEDLYQKPDKLVILLHPAESEDMPVDHGLVLSRGIGKRHLRSQKLLKILLCVGK